MLDKTRSWKLLQEHYQNIKNLNIADELQNNLQRAQEYNIRTKYLFGDYSKCFANQETIKLLCDLAAEQKLAESIQAMFLGENINISENRPALHIALRDSSHKEVLAVQDKMRALTENILSGKWRGFSDKKITDIVNIGIGGSDLGPKMAYFALRKFWNNDLRCHFVSNIDPAALDHVLEDINLETTIFIISSKSFSTIETLTNATRAREKLLAICNNPADVAKHFLAVSSNVAKAVEFGIAKENIFPMWDWVGGRYSLWSAIGLPIALGTNFNIFMRLLAGAHDLDQHFLNTKDWTKNLPVILGLLSVWYRNFVSTHTEAIVAYADDLEHFVPHMQQLIMESNGKSLSRDNKKLSYNTCPIIWGGVGTNCQHAFMQLLHQGTEYVPCDFIVCAKSLYADAVPSQQILNANAIAQAQTLMLGDQNEKNYKVLPGNKPSNFIILDELTPETLGSLIALYEHKTFVQGILWDINSFDQWGVEKGKKCANDILAQLQGVEKINSDPSSANLLYYLCGATEEK
jgi:glucose-6-phosphate isomerase